MRKEVICDLEEKECVEVLEREDAAEERFAAVALMKEVVRRCISRPSELSER